MSKMKWTGDVRDSTNEPPDFKLMGLMGHALVMWIFNATPEDFNETFGEVGPHLWDKFEGQYDRQEGRLICGMDYHNAEKLARAAYQKYIPELLQGCSDAERIRAWAEGRE